MAGYFEIVDAPHGGYRFRLFDKSGRMLAVSPRFPTKRDAAAAITVVREIAGTGLIRDMSSGHTGEPIPHPIKPARTAPRNNGAHHFHANPSNAVHSR
jgi:uncharacterized protein YegP (UPF0339 family)